MAPAESGKPGASSGIGKAAARRLHAEGWNVIATMRSPERENELIALEAVLVTRLDVLDVASIGAAVDAGLQRFGRIDVLLNNAGYGAYGPLEATPLDKVRRQFDVNVMGVLATTQAMLPHMRQHRSGVIVNVSSIGGKITFSLGTLYHGTKFAVEELSEAPHYELLPLGILVRIVEPGPVLSRQHPSSPPSRSPSCRVKSPTPSTGRFASGQARRWLRPDSKIHRLQAVQFQHPGDIHDFHCTVHA